jgi:hypothetical protein
MPTIHEIIAKAEKAKQKKFEEAKPIALTRQALYGDLQEEEEAIKSAESDEFGFIEEDLGRLDRENLAERKAAVEAEKQRRYEREVQKASGEVATTEEGTRVRIPTPAMADNPLLVMGARAVSEAGRGVASLFGEEEAIPQIRDESDVVNIGSEVLQLATGGAGGAIVGAKILSKVVKAAPKASKWYGALLGAPAGEAVVATEETGTLSGDEGDTALDRKMQVLMEGIGFGGILTGAGKVAKTIYDLGPIGRIINSLPTALVGTRAGAERLVGDSIADMIIRAERATTPEDKAAALQRIQDKIATGFEEQTGLKFQDYLDGKVELPDEFLPTFGGTADLEAIARLERGVAQKEGMPEFSGVWQRQREAMVEGAEQTAESALPAGARLEEETAKEAAERLGTEAREEVGGVVQQRIAQTREETVEPLENLLATAEKEVSEQMGEQGEITFAGLQRVVENRQGANNAAQEATNLVQETYRGQQKIKGDLYEEYGGMAADIEVPATSFEKSLIDMIDERQIANISSIVGGADPKYQKVLQQLADQRQRLAQAINKQVGERIRKLEAEMINAKTPSGSETAYKLTDADKRLIQDQANADIDLDAAVKAADFRDVKLNDIEGMLQYVNSIKNKPNVDQATQSGMERLSRGLEAIIVDTLGEGSEALAKRTQAIEYFQNFNDLYKTATGGKMIPNFRFGDKITPQQLAQAQDGLTIILREAKDKNASLEFIMDLRNSMDEGLRGQFDRELGKFYRQEIFSKVRFDPTVASAAENPARAAETMANQLRRALSEYPNLDKVAPGIAQDLNKLADDLAKSGTNTLAAKKQLKNVEKLFEQVRKEFEATPEGQFAKQKYNSATKAVRGMLVNEDYQKQFPRIWETAGQAGQKGADGLTDAQRKIKATMARGAMDLIYPAGARGKEAGELSFAQIENAINENPVFNQVFPKGDPTREMFDMMTARARAMDKRSVRAVTGESATASISDVGQLVSEFINYVQGPLSKPGRRSKMISKVFFKLAGGPDAASNVMVDMMTDTRLAYTMLEEAKKRVGQTGEDLGASLTKVAGAYILSRMGVNSVDELNSELASVTLEDQTEEAFAQ